MNICSEVYKDCKVVFFKKEVEFDSKGVAKVEKSLGTKILKGFPKMWEEGNKIEPEKEKFDKETEENNYKVEGLKNEIERLKMMLSQKDKQIDEAKKSEQVWRDAFKKKEEEMKDLGDSPETETTDTEDEFTVIDGVNVPVGMENIYEEMKAKNFPQLKSWVISELAPTDEEKAGFANKESLVQFVFDKMKS